jgi:hypothetical protein
MGAPAPFTWPGDPVAPTALADFARRDPARRTPAADGRAEVGGR